MTLYIHECGKRYLQTSTGIAPPRCKLVVCDQCLEPMPVCNEKRIAFAYQQLGDFSLRHLIPQPFVARAPAAAA